MSLDTFLNVWGLMFMWGAIISLFMYGYTYIAHKRDEVRFTQFMKFTTIFLFMTATAPLFPLYIVIVFYLLVMDLTHEDFLEEEET